MTETPNPHIVDADTLTGEMRPIRQLVVSLGSNLGDRIDNLQGAVRALADTPDVWVTGVSPVYETEPVDAPEGSDNFLNAVVLADTTLAAQPADGPGAGHRGRLRPGALRGQERPAHPRRRPDRRRRPAQRRRRRSGCRTRARPSARSCCGRGSTSTRRPTCSATVGSPTCSPPSAESGVERRDDLVLDLSEPVARADDLTRRRAGRPSRLPRADPARRGRHGLGASPGWSSAGCCTRSRSRCGGPRCWSRGSSRPPCCCSP